MSDQILLVDDEPNVLSAYRRQLRRNFSVDTAEGGQPALDKIAEGNSYAVIMSDMQMPGMNGVEFLQEVRKVSPDSVRLMLTGNADQRTATEAINQGAVFRFLNKPCSPEEMSSVITTALEQHRLITAEKQLLEETLKGSVSVLTEILALVNPVAFGRAKGIQDHVRRICKHVKVERPWELEIAAMLSQLGCVTIPEDVLTRASQLTSLSDSEHEMVQNHPSVASGLIRRIPRLDNVAELIECQKDDFGAVCESKAPSIEQRILKAASILHDNASSGNDGGVAMNRFREDYGLYGDELVGALEKTIQEMPSSSQDICFDDLRCGMVVAEPIRNDNGQTLVAMGQEITETLLIRLRNFARNVGIAEPIKVYVRAGV